MHVLERLTCMSARALAMDAVPRKASTPMCVSSFHAMMHLGETPKATGEATPTALERFAQQ